MLAEQRHDLPDLLSATCAVCNFLELLHDLMD